MQESSASSGRDGSRPAGSPGRPGTRQSQPRPARRGLFGIPLDGEPTARRLARVYGSLVRARSGMPAEWTAQTIGAIGMAAQWLDDANGAWRQGLIVTGPCGGGKTTLIQAVAILVERLAPVFAAQGDTDAFGRPAPRPAARRIVYCKAADLYGDTGLNPESPEWQAQSQYARCRDAGLCLVDDVGHEVTSYRRYGNEYRLVADLVQERYNARRPLVVSSNLSLDDLATKYGRFVVDRLYEMCHFVRIEQRSFREAKRMEG